MLPIRITHRRTALAVVIGALCVVWPARTILSQAYGPPSRPPAPAADRNVAPQPTAADASAGVEPLTSGPVHEAFAEPLDYNAAKPLVVSQEPPAAIEEVPPEAKPEGTNVTWIPGYWGWGDDRRSFIWISGIWRDAPAGEVWVSGYWTAINGGYQWVPGFWTSAETQQVNYLPEPPAALTETASTPSPGDNYFRVPGNWLYADGRYVWRAGYWSESNPDWVWQPAHYCWTPQGYVYLAGYWDFPLVDRGVLFAPIAFSRPIYAQRQFVFTPQIVIDAGLLTANFFVRPDYCHYYFGDFYGQTYARVGIEPWFSVRSRYGFGYDPLFAYYRSYYAQRDPGWFNRLEQRNVFLTAHPEARPPRTYLDARRIAERGGRVDAFTSIAQNNALFAAPLADVVNRRVTFSTNDRVRGTTSLRFTNLAPQQRQDYARQAAIYHEFAQRRAELERTPQRGTPGRTAPGTAVTSQGRHGLDLSPLISAETQGRPGARVAQRPNLEGQPGVEVQRPGTAQPGARRPGEEAIPGTTPRGTTPNEVTPRGVTPRETFPPRESGPRESTPREAIPREGISPREVAPREGGPRPVTPREPIPREAPRDNVPREAAPREIPREVPREAPRQVVPREAAPRQPAPRQPAPREAAPSREAAPPREAAPRQAAPQREPTPREAAPPHNEPKPSAESRPNPGNRTPADRPKDDGKGK